MPPELHYYSGCQNTFVVLIDGGHFPEYDARFISYLCQKVDGLLLIRPSKVADAKMIYFNKDGSRASMCGNGLRCVAHLAQKKLFPEKSMLTIETDVGVLQASIQGNIVEVEMGQITNHKFLSINGQKVCFLNTGVPHAVIQVDTIESVDVATLGKEIRFHPAFQPEGTNVTFASLLNNGSADLSTRTYERGVEAETLACGTGAVAAALVLWDQFPKKQALQVLCASGELLTVRKEGSSLFLKGAVSPL